MPIFELTHDAVVRVQEKNFSSLGVKEKDDLQRILRTQLTTILPNVYVLAEEFGEWEDSQRRIDLLCLDKDANLVVVELKRTDDGGHMELQAIRYAAMVSKMTFVDAVSAHSKFLAKIKKDAGEAEAEILRFLGWESHDPRNSEMKFE